MSTKPVYMRVCDGCKVGLPMSTPNVLPVGWIHFQANVQHPGGEIKDKLAEGLDFCSLKCLQGTLDFVKRNGLL